jgi:hypothetical protein
LLQLFNDVYPVARNNLGEKEFQCTLIEIWNKLDADHFTILTDSEPAGTEKNHEILATAGKPTDNWT